MGKIGQQKAVYKPAAEPKPVHMEKFLTRSGSPASSDPTSQTLRSADSPDQMAEVSQLSQAPPGLTVDILDAKLHTLLQNISHTIATEVGKIAQDLRGEIALVEERTDRLENKMDELINYVQVLEEDNHTLKQQITLLQSQQEDLENRERRQNLRIRGVPETVGDAQLHEYLLGLFVTLAPTIPDIDWRMDRAHRSLAPKPPVGARPRDIIIKFHYYESKESLLNSTRNKTSITYKGEKLQIFSDLSPITLAKRRSLRPVTLHLQKHCIIYRWGFPFKLTVTKDGVQHHMRDLQEAEAFLSKLDLPHLPDDIMGTPTSRLRPATTPKKLWTPASKSKTRLPIPQRTPRSRLDTGT